MILVTGAAGKSGTAVIRALAAQGVPARGLVRRPEQEAPLLAAGAVETEVGDMRHPGSLAQACRGVDAVYHICPNMSPDEQEIGARLIAAAQEQRLSHIVYHSVLHPQVEAMPHHWAKMRVEEMLFTAGLPVTILQPAAYMQNIAGVWGQILDEGIYRVPYPVETRISLVDLEDVAQAAARVLTDPDLRGGTYELCGPQPLSQADVAAILSKTLGRRVRAEAIDPLEWRQGAEAAGIGGYQLDGLLKMFDYYRQVGFTGSGWLLAQLLGRPATTFEQFIQRLIPT